MGKLKKTIQLKMNEDKKYNNRKVAKAQKKNFEGIQFRIVKNSAL